MTTLTAKPRPRRAGEMPRTAKTLVALMALLGLALFVPSLASAEFSRPYLTQITGAPTGPLGEEVPFDFNGGAGGIAIEPRSEDVYVGDNEGGAGVVDEFNSSGAFLAPQLTGLPAESLAFDDESGKLEAVGGGMFVAVDNAAPAAGDVYHAQNINVEYYEGSAGPFHKSVGNVSRVDESGKPVPFTCPEGVAGGYINAEGDLIGRSGGPWEDGVSNALSGIVVDSGGDASAGDVYVAYQPYGGATDNEVDQFTSTGCFVRALTEAGAPLKPFENALEGLAVDPTNGDVVVETAEGAGGEISTIDEFTSDGEYLGQISGVSQSAPFGEDALSVGDPRTRNGVAVSPAGDLYVSVCATVLGKPTEAHTCAKYVVDEFGPGAFYPTVVTGEVSDGRESSAVLSGTVDDEDLALTACRFEYVEAAKYDPSASDPFAGGGSAECEPGAGAIPVDKGEHAVQVQASGLVSGTVYDYRLVASTGGAHGGTRDGHVESFAAVAEPVVEDVSVGDVSSSFADFSASIDPRGSATTYQFQYVEAAGYEAAVAAGAGDPYADGGSVPVPAGDAGAGDRPVNVSVQAGGLSPGSSYDYRVVASNGAGVKESENGTFATAPAGLEGLPDGRAYELLTPPNKGSAEDMFGSAGLPGEEEVNLDVGYASEDGDHFLLFSKAAFGPLPASDEGAYVFSRGQSGWSFQSVASPGLGVQAVGSTVFDPVDFSIVGVEDGAGHNGLTRIDLAGPPGGPYATVASDTGAEGEGGGESEYPVVVGASEDLSRVLVESRNHKLALCESSQQAGAEALDAGSEAVYEWSSARGCLSLLDAKSQSQGGGLLSKCGAVLGRGEVQLFAGDMHGAVSADGSRAFFTAPDPDASGPECWNKGASHTPQLYMRVGGETTVPVSAPEAGVVPEKTYPAIYVGAAADGSRVFFMTRTQLTADAVAARTHGLELYEYDTQTGALARVSRGDSGDAEGNVDDVPAISPDGSSVYLNAQGELAPHPPGAPSGGLYRYDTLTGRTAYVAPIQGYPEMQSIDSHGTEHIRTPWYIAEINDKLVPSLEVEAPYYTTADGQFLLFGPYRYDAADGSVVCVMCNPDGSGPIPDASFVRSAVWAGGGHPAGLAPRGISENGEYVFFDTKESLVPQDTNGQLDVYEWHDGAIDLISSGEDPAPSYFLDSSPDGSNVFFGTHAKLVPADTGSEGNLYDARIGGGFQESTGTRPCEGDACDNPPLAPIEQTPASLTFSGAGNLSGEPIAETKPKPATVKCHKGFVKKKVKKKTECVKAKSKRSKKAKKTNRKAK